MRVSRIMSWIYEVNLFVDEEIKDAYLEWLRAHIQEMLELPCFDNATLYCDEVNNWVVHYYAPSRESIDTYLETYAQQMRGDSAARFSGKFKAKRRILGACPGGVF